jgi:hypothetical protein
VAVGVIAAAITLQPSAWSEPLVAPPSFTEIVPEAAFPDLRWLAGLRPYDEWEEYGGVRPVPGTLVLLGTGLVWLGAVGRQATRERRLR